MEDRISVRVFALICQGKVTGQLFEFLRSWVKHFNFQLENLLFQLHSRNHLSTQCEPPSIKVFISSESGVCCSLEKGPFLIGFASKPSYCEYWWLCDGSVPWTCLARKRRSEPFAITLNAKEGRPRLFLTLIWLLLGLEAYDQFFGDPASTLCQILITLAQTIAVFCLDHFITTVTRLGYGRAVC